MLHRNTMNIDIFIIFIVLQSRLFVVYTVRITIEYHPGVSVALKFQYNKTAMQQLRRQLHIRENALPTLQAKEAALRLEVKKARDEVKKTREELERKKVELAEINRLWPEFPQQLLSVSEVAIDMRKIAGVQVPVFRQVNFIIKPFSLFTNPGWIVEGLRLLKESAIIQIKIRIFQRQADVLEYARKKTTQKVNLYEKVQIPEYRDAILRIKRYLEDEENLAKSAQKILKTRLAQAEAALYDR